ncbi:MAG: sigma-70 family RNA polymerase sigma factor [Planctomycetes bacterium]|nr:sigma-70 family RNA polymerase sigma factor [Planctomycetota bacterium]
MTPSPQELELTQDLLDYARAVALIEAQKRCPKYVEFDDVVQHALLHLMSKPPKYDPARGASPKTLIYTIVQRAVMKFVALEVQHAGRSEQVVTPKTGDDDDREAALEAFSLKERYERGLEQLLIEDRTAEATFEPPEDVFEFIDNEDSRALCKLYIKCKGNVSETARRLGVTEGAVRHRLKMLAPKLRAAGFDPFEEGT